MWAVKPTTLQQPLLLSSSSPPCRKSMPALLVFLPSSMKAQLKGEQRGGLLLRPWPAVCGTIWELLPSTSSFLGLGVCSGLTGPKEHTVT